MSDDARKGTAVGTRITAKKMEILKLNAAISGKTVAVYLRDLIDKDIEDDELSMIDRQSVERQLLEVSADINEINEEIHLLKQLVIKLAKASVTAAVIAENSVDDMTKNNARSIAVKFVDDHIASEKETKTEERFI